MDDNPPQNPYLNPDLTLAPFAGRQAMFARLHQQLTDPARREALLFLGQRHMGKTALLRQFPAVFDEAFVGVYVSLKETPLDDDSGWLLALYRASAAALNERGFTLTRLSDPPDDLNTLRAWLTETGLSELGAIIRPHRRLVWLLDDAEKLIDAVVGSRLPMDSFAYGQTLLAQHPQLVIVLTASADYESDLGAMSPLVNPTEVVRLTTLSELECADVLRQPVPYMLDDEAAAAVYRAAGGRPLLVQRFGFHLYRRWQTEGHDTLAVDDVKAVTTLVFAESHDEFDQTWQSLTRNERLVLTAMSSLLYDDPLRSVDTDAIQSWLVDTDYPLDSTAIKAAVRGLEYREIVNLTHSSVTLTSGLMQKWLVENARLDERPLAGAAARLPRRWIVLLLALAVVVLVIVFVLTQVMTVCCAPPPGLTPQPTVTLVSRE